MDYSYESLLTRAQENASETVKEKARFEVPKVLGHLEGNKTVVTNFVKIADTLNRPAEHLQKYVLRELATPGVIRAGFLLLGAKINSIRINEKIRHYTEEFVLCMECGKPDTQLQKEGDMVYLRCQACGAKRHVKTQL